MDSLDCLYALLSRPEPSHPDTLEMAIAMTGIDRSSAEIAIASRPLSAGLMDALFACRTTAFANRMGLPVETALDVMPAEPMDYRIFLETVIVLSMRESVRATDLATSDNDPWIDTAQAIAAVGWAMARDGNFSVQAA